MYTSFKEFHDNLNEAKFVAKRKYTDRHPEEVMSTNAPIRNKVLEFLNDKGSVSHEEFREFLLSLSEDKSRTASWSWVRKNSDLIDRYVNENGEVSYLLTKRGKRIFELSKKLVESTENEDFTEISEKTIKLLNEKGITPHLEINSERAEDECEGNVFSGDLHAEFKDIVVVLGEPAMRTPKRCEWYLFDKKTKLAYTIKNKDGVRYRQAKGVPFEVWCNTASRGFNAASFIQSLIDVEIDWVKVGENRNLFIKAKTINERIEDFSELIEEGTKEEYEKFFREKLKKYGVESPADLSEEEKKKFFNEIKKEWDKE